MAYPALRALLQVRLQLQSFGFTKGEATKVPVYRGTPLHVLATIVRNEGITGPFKVDCTLCFAVCVVCWVGRANERCWPNHLQVLPSALSDLALDLAAVACMPWWLRDPRGALNPRRVWCPASTDRSSSPASGWCGAPDRLLTWPGMGHKIVMTEALLPCSSSHTWRKTLCVESLAITLQTSQAHIHPALALLRSQPFTELSRRSSASCTVRTGARSSRGRLMRCVS
jgi:hypothetical protein